MRRTFIPAVVAAAAAVSPALASEAFVGRWALDPANCMKFGSAGTAAPLTVYDTSLSWVSGFCRFGKMYKAGQAVYIQAHCTAEGKGNVPVTLEAHGDRMRVAWDGSTIGEMRRCP
jgi:hypothetical protein